MNTSSAYPITIAQIHQVSLDPWIKHCRVILEQFGGLERVIESPEELPSATASEMWHPLTEPLENFNNRHDKAVHFWRERVPWPSPVDFRGWLDQWVYC